MIKKIITLGIGIFLVLMMGTVTVQAETDGVYEYEVLEDGTIKITDYTGDYKELTIPDEIDGKTVTVIGENAFTSQFMLETVTIGDMVTSIEKSAFEGCTFLETVTIGDSVTVIGESAFNNCGKLENVIWGDSVTTIGDSAFFDCDSLTGVDFPDSLTSIGYKAFANGGLESIEIEEHVTYIGEDAFANSSYMKTIYVDCSGEVGKGAFQNCYFLEEVIIGENVTSIGTVAFHNNSNLAKVTIGENVTTIGDRVFEHAVSLKSVVIPAGVTSIGERAFGYTYLEGTLESILIDGVTLHCYSGTAGENYAKDNGIAYEIIDNTSGENSSAEQEENVGAGDLEQSIVVNGEEDNQAEADSKGKTSFIIPILIGASVLALVSVLLVAIIKRKSSLEHAEK